MKKWYHVGFVVICAGVLAVLLSAPEVTTPLLPSNADHSDRKDFERCPSCHAPESDAPMPTDHLDKGGEPRPDRKKCYFCHRVEKD
jgi:cytochrome c2